MTHASTILKAALAACISDVWGNRRRESEIRVVHPRGMDAFPYENSSERRDQLRNARSFAAILVRDRTVTQVVDSC